MNLYKSLIGWVVTTLWYRWRHTHWNESGKQGVRGRYRLWAVVKQTRVVRCISVPTHVRIVFSDLERRTIGLPYNVSRSFSWQWKNVKKPREGSSHKAVCKKFNISFFERWLGIIPTVSKMERQLCRFRLGDVFRLALCFFNFRIHFQTT